jgi:hypothetical protein
MVKQHRNWKPTQNPKLISFSWFSFLKN